MKFTNLSIESVAVELPRKVITSAELEERLAPVIRRLKLPPKPISLLTGIETRRFWEPGLALHEVAARAGSRALELAAVPPERVGLLINTSVSREFLEPSTAALVHGILGLPTDCRNFDVANACLGFF